MTSGEAFFPQGLLSGKPIVLTVIVWPIAWSLWSSPSTVCKTALFPTFFAYIVSSLKDFPSAQQPPRLVRDITRLQTDFQSIPIMLSVSEFIVVLTQMYAINGFLIIPAKLAAGIHVEPFPSSEQGFSSIRPER